MIIKKTSPDIYHGYNKKAPFFEGWYFKLSDIESNLSLAFIPGIIKGPNGHSFIQYVNGITKDFHYFSFKEESFVASSKNLNLCIGKNSFSLSSLNLQLEDKSLKIDVELALKEIYSWPDTLLNPGSMGFYNHIPFMECYSQVCAIDGSASGQVNINGQITTLASCKVYIEKNWGKSFPYSWFWIQCNSFKEQLALTCSIAHIPFPVKSFRGHLIGLMYKGQFIKFTTINRSSLSIRPQGKDITIIAANKNYELTIQTTTEDSDFLLLHSPSKEAMHPSVKESIISKVQVILKSLPDKRTIINQQGLMAGIEYGGNYQELLF